MGWIPALSNKQVDKLRQLLNSVPSSNQVPQSHNSSRRAPVYYDDDIDDANNTVALAKITGGNATSGYTAEIYANGRGQSPTGSGSIFLPEVALTGSLPVGTWVLAHLSEVVVTGGNDA